MVDHSTALTEVAITSRAPRSQCSACAHLCQSPHMSLAATSAPSHSAPGEWSIMGTFALVWQRVLSIGGVNVANFSEACMQILQCCRTCCEYAGHWLSVSVAAPHT